MGYGKDLGLILTDFTNVYNLFEKPVSREAGIYEMNGGWCGVVASLCAYIFKTKYNLENVNICSNALHIYISYEGKDYDTIYPEGYPHSATKDWLLKEIGENSEASCVSAGSEINKGYWDWGFINMFKVMCKRWNIPLPSYFDSYVAGAERMTTNADVRKRKRKMESIYNSALELPFVSSVIRNKVLPFTHYEHGEYEKGSKRELKKKDFLTLDQVLLTK